MKKVFTLLLLSFSFVSFSSETFNGVTEKNKACRLTVHERSSTGMTVSSSQFKKQFVESDNGIEFFKGEVNAEMNVYESIIVVLLDDNGDPKGYSHYDRKTVPLIGPFFPKLVNCKF